MMMMMMMISTTLRSLMAYDVVRCLRSEDEGHHVIATGMMRFWVLWVVEQSSGQRSRFEAKPPRPAWALGLAVRARRVRGVPDLVHDVGWWRGAEAIARQRH